MAGLCGLGGDVNMPDQTPRRDERTIRLMAEALRPEAREAFIQYMLAYEEERAKSENP